LIHLVDGIYGMDGTRGDAMIKGRPLSTVFPNTLLMLVLLVSACNALEKPTTMIPTVEIADRATQRVMPKTNIADPTLAPGMTSTPVPVPLVTATTSARSETRVFSTTLHVVTARTLLTAGEILTVTVSIRDDSVGCCFVAMDLTLSSDWDQVPADAIVPVRIGELDGEFVRGRFVVYVGETVATWEPDASILRLRWVKDGIWFEMTKSGHAQAIEYLDQAGLIELAESLVSKR